MTDAAASVPVVPAGWTSDDVLAASAAWTWFPADARTVRGELTIVDWPDWSPNGAVVVATRSTRPPTELLAEARDVARAWGHDDLGWWTSGADHPDLAPLLAERGARTVEVVDVLARGTGPADRVGAADLVPGVDVREVAGLEDVRDADVVDAEVWEQRPMDAARLEAALAELRPADDGTGAVRVVARLDGRPVATGGATVVDGPRAGTGRVARLWGAATLPDARGRGAYRAVLTERLRLAAARGATLALVKGRVESSAPILTRLGFARHATEQLWRLPV